MYDLTNASTFPFLLPVTAGSQNDFLRKWLYQCHQKRSGPGQKRSERRTRGTEDENGGYWGIVTQRT